MLRDCASAACLGLTAQVDPRPNLLPTTRPSLHHLLCQATVDARRRHASTASSQITYSHTYTHVALAHLPQPSCGTFVLCPPPLLLWATARHDSPIRPRPHTQPLLCASVRWLLHLTPHPRPSASSSSNACTAVSHGRLLYHSAHHLRAPRSHSTLWWSLASCHDQQPSTGRLFFHRNIQSHLRNALQPP